MNQGEQILPDRCQTISEILNYMITQLVRKNMGITQLAISLSEQGIMPDAIVRAGIRRLSETRLTEIYSHDCEQSSALRESFFESMKRAPIAPLPEKANEQHYEVPAKFFEYVLGDNRKYSSCYWGSDTQNLNEAEALALKATCEHAQLVDGQTILELGCGWGSLTLWMAKHFPNSQITAVSNSNSQRDFITQTAKNRGLNNVQVITCDMNTFDIQQQFDRIVSVEMFEHMRNYEVLYKKVHDWLKPGGKFFKHIFCHRSTPYAFEVKGDDDWMSALFFSGGFMPSDDTPTRFQTDLKLIQQWRWDGTHYEKTANAWLKNMDAHYDEVTAILNSTYGVEHTQIWRQRWRIFFMACAELFGYNNGQEWWVSHYLFEKPAA